MPAIYIVDIRGIAKSEWRTKKFWKCRPAFFCKSHADISFYNFFKVQKCRPFILLNSKSGCNKTVSKTKRFQKCRPFILLYTKTWRNRKVLAKSEFRTGKFRKCRPAFFYKNCVDFSFFEVWKVLKCRHWILLYTKTLRNRKKIFKSELKKQKSSENAGRLFSAKTM